MWAIVPVKPFALAKSRLATVLSPQERAILSREFLEHTLAVLQAVPLIKRRLVISRDPKAISLAREHEALTISESGTPSLNQTLQRATQLTLAYGARGVVIVPTDLPLLTAEDVTTLMNMAEGDPAVVIAPDRHDEGTNALVVRPPGQMAYAFGAHSFAAHTAQARAAGLEPHICRLPGLALDVDLPTDLEFYKAHIATHESNEEAG